MRMALVGALAIVLVRPVGGQGTHDSIMGLVVTHDANGNAGKSAIRNLALKPSRKETFRTNNARVIRGTRTESTRIPAS
jgi:hypothetical protein